MKRQFALPLLLRVIGTLQLLALWLWGLMAWTWGQWGYTLATLLISTAYIMLWLALHDREVEPVEDRPFGRPARDTGIPRER